MGLLEKAYEYKKHINSKGKETLLDRIKGPAETEFVHEKSTPSDDFLDDQDQIIGITPEVSDDIPLSGDARQRIADVDDQDFSQGVEDQDIILSEKDLEDLSFGDELGREQKGDRGGGLDVDDDLFTLPDEETVSPQDILDTQKKSDALPVANDRIDDDMVGKYTESRKILPDKKAVVDVFGPEDVPDMEVIGKQMKNPEVRSMEMNDRLKAVKSKDVSPIEDEEGDAILEDVDHVRMEKNRPPLSDMDEQEIRISPDIVNEGDKSVDVDRDNQISDIEPGMVVKHDKKFHDFMVLYEIGKEIVKSENRKELYDVVLFSIMGQIGASSSSIMIADPDNERRFIIADSRGVTIRNKKLYFDVQDKILGDILKRKDIIDLEEYKNQPEHRDEYYKYISIDARLISPLNHDGNVIGAVVLGDKITIGDYSDEEKDFILSVSEISALALQKINNLEKYKDENENYKREIEHINNVDSFQDKIVSDVSLKRLEELIASEFSDLGIAVFALYVHDDRHEKFFPLITEKEDFLGLKESNYSFDLHHPFIGYIHELKEAIKVEEFKRIKVIKDSFSEGQLSKMEFFWIYPFKFGNRLTGFTVVNDIEDQDREKEIHDKLVRLNKVLFSYVLNIKSMDIQENKYIDYVGITLKRIEREIENAKNLRIPLTLILFSIKNFKRYYNLFGNDEVKKIVDTFEMVIRSRLSDPDFSVRYDRNKLLMVLPGKNKKFAVPLANTIRNEMIQSFKKKEMQLLVTFLTAEYPEDGEDLNLLLDSID